MRLNRLTEKVREAYENYEYHVIYHAIHNFCVVDLSNFYLDVIKDRLYCESHDGLKRRGAQTAMYWVLDAMVRMLAPILAYTSEEIWQFMPHHAKADRESVLFNAMPETNPAWELPEETAANWEKLLSVRERVNLSLERARADKLIGKPLEARVTLSCGPEMLSFLKSFEDKLSDLFIVSGVALKPGDGELDVSVERISGEKCPRCWMYASTIGHDPGHPELCARCADVVSGIN
jgi:isoleucyl-tRNA synthetase